MNKNELSSFLNETRGRISAEIRERPLTSLGIAFGIGAVIGIAGAQATRHPAKGWLERLTDTLSDRYDDAKDYACDMTERASDEIRSAARSVADTASDVDIEKFVRRTRRWLKALMR